MYAEIASPMILSS